jgi:hypothetical protein
MMGLHWLALYAALKNKERGCQIIDGDPSEDISTLLDMPKIQVVMRAGKVVVDRRGKG